MNDNKCSGDRFLSFASPSSRRVVRFVHVWCVHVVSMMISFLIPHRMPLFLLLDCMHLHHRPFLVSVLRQKERRHSRRQPLFSLHHHRSRETFVFPSFFQRTDYLKRGIAIHFSLSKRDQVHFIIVCFRDQPSMHDPCNPSILFAERKTNRDWSLQFHGNTLVSLSLSLFLLP